MAEAVSDHRGRMELLEADAATWLDAHPPPADTSRLYSTLAEMPFLYNMSKHDYKSHSYVSEMALEAIFCMGRDGLPIPLPRSRTECACADLNDLDVQKIYLSGSARERTEVRIFADEASDVDVMFQLGPVSFMGASEHAGPGAGSVGDTGSSGATGPGLEVFQERTAQPGFVLLRHRRLDSCQHAAALPLDAGRVIRLMDSFRRQTTRRPSSQSGPSVTTTFHGQHGDWTSIDLVACVPCPSWPQEDFASRERPSGFPSERLVEKLCRTPAFLVPVGFRGSPTEEQEWRLSFSRHEYIAYRSMTKEQRLCLTTLKHCRAVIGGVAKPLKSYYLKTALMWLAEQRAADQWTLETMHESLLLILRYLDVCLRRGYLPCYFWPEVNLLTSRSAEERAELAAAVTELRSRLLQTVLALLADWLGQSVPTLAQCLLVDCQWMSARHLGIMTLAKSFDAMSGGDSGALVQLFEPLVNGRLWPLNFASERALPQMWSVLHPGFLVSGSVTRRNNQNSERGELIFGSVLSGFMELLLRHIQHEPEPLEDSWMVEE